MRSRDDSPEAAACHGLPPSGSPPAAVPSSPSTTESIPSSARAAVLLEPGKPLACRTLEVSPPATGELLVRVAACSVCGSDLHTAHGRRPHPVPTILGHEIVGRIAAIGPGDPPQCVDGRPLAVGDRITWAVCASCGVCDRCRRGMPQKCRRLVKYGHAALESPHGLSGGLAEFVRVFPGTAIVRVPDTLSDIAAAPASCCVATAAAILRTARQQRAAFAPQGPPLAEASVAVLGGGMLGLSAISLLRAAGCRRLLLIDPQPDRRRLAEMTWPGLATTAPPAVQPAAAAAADEPLVPLLAAAGATPASNGETFPADGFDLVVEASGAAPATGLALELVATGGCCVLAGSVSPGPPVACDPERIIRRQIAIHGVHNYLPQDLVAAVSHLAEDAGRALSDLVGPVFPLEQVNDALDRAAGNALRVVVTP